MFADEEGWEDGTAVKERIAEREHRMIVEEAKDETEDLHLPAQGMRPVHQRVYRAAGRVLLQRMPGSGVLPASGVV